MRMITRSSGWTTTQALISGPLPEVGVLPDTGADFDQSEWPSRVAAAADEREADHQRPGGGTADESTACQVQAHVALLTMWTMSMPAVRVVPPAACLMAVRTRL